MIAPTDPYARLLDGVRKSLTDAGAAMAVADVFETRMKRILVVEDDRPLNFAFRFWLELGGYEVLSAYSGRSALAQSRALKPDLILLDVGLPDMNGLTAAQELLSSRYTSEIPILFVTGDTSPNIAQFASESGVRSVLHKPVQAKDLTDAIGAILRES